jgi:ATP-binding cassette subfamily F protein 3
VIRIEGLRKLFGAKTVLDTVSYHFQEGERVALVGANGAGKTTLLDILTGEIEPDAGVVIKPGRLRLGYLPQEPNANPRTSILDEVLAGGDGLIQSLVRRHRRALDDMTSSYSEDRHRAWEVLDEEYKREGGYSLEASARAILAGLGFAQSMFEQAPNHLSGGWRMRLELAKIFLNRPNFLVLDEPTNHLDLPSLIWVEKWLENFQGTLLFVSHDRSLLKRLPTITLHLQNGRLTPYSGNFDSFLEQREARQELEAAQAENLRKRREHLEGFVTRFGAKASKASQAQSKMKMIARIRDLESDVVLDNEVDSMHVQIPVGQPSGREVFRIKQGAIGYAKALSENVNLLIERGQKIAVIGANGIGKSTLLKTVVNEISPLAGEFVAGHNVRTAWFAQDQLSTLDPHKNILDNVLDVSVKVTQVVARNVLGSLLFRGDDVYKKVSVLSGGEKARVGLARLLLQEANFLVLDEPTNHLDISSCEILSQAVIDFEGTVLFVSHDREFIDSVCTHIYAMLPDGRGQLFEGRLDDYERMADKSGFPNVLNPTPLVADDAARSPLSAGSVDHDKLAEQDIQRLKRETQKNQKMAEKLESEMERIQGKIRDCDEQMEQSHSDFSNLAVLAEKKRLFESELAHIEEQWLGVSEKIEKARCLLGAMGRSI